MHGVAVTITIRAAIAATAMAAGLIIGHAAHAEAITIPANIGVAPAVHFITGPVQRDQSIHTGLKLSFYGIIDQPTLQANAQRIPERYRAAVTRMKELRIGPSIFIPDTLFLSPKVKNTQMWGASWTPLGLGIALLRSPVRIWLGTALRITYAYIESDTLGTTHFLRPGLDANLDIEIPMGDSFALSLGWTSQFYIPQPVGGGVFEVGPIDKAIWHMGQAYLMLNFRFPYTVNL